jgi:hypothetical protein
MVLPGSLFSCDSSTERKANSTPQIPTNQMPRIHCEVMRRAEINWTLFRSGDCVCFDLSG